MPGLKPLKSLEEFTVKEEGSAPERDAACTLDNAAACLSWPAREALAGPDEPPQALSREAANIETLKAAHLPPEFVEYFKCIPFIHKRHSGIRHAANQSFSEIAAGKKVPPGIKVSMRKAQRFILFFHCCSYCIFMFKTRLPANAVPDANLISFEPRNAPAG